MDIEQIKKVKAEAEAELVSAIAPILERIQQKVPIPLKWVSVNLIDITTMERQEFIPQVRISFDTGLE